MMYHTLHDHVLWPGAPKHIYCQDVQPLTPDIWVQMVLGPEHCESLQRILEYLHLMPRSKETLRCLVKMVWQCSQRARLSVEQFGCKLYHLPITYQKSIILFIHTGQLIMNIEKFQKWGTSYHGWWTSMFRCQEGTVLMSDWLFQRSNLKFNTSKETGLQVFRFMGVLYQFPSFFFQKTKT